KSEKYFDSSKLEKYIINAIYKDVIQIMNLKTFHTLEIEMKSEPQFEKIKEGTEISGFREGEKLYLIPFYKEGQDTKNE
ncbi:MAG: hypothetical protein ACTSO9_18455, partial [Candidatus Helarchaeota archaeon]